MTAWYRACFLFSSFGPLYVLVSAGLATQYDWSKWALCDPKFIAVAVAALLSALSFAAFLLLIHGFKSNSPSRFTVSDPEPLDQNVLNYMISYIPPLMIDNYLDLNKVVPVSIFYIIIFIIMFRTDTMYVNPYFLIFRIKIFKVALPSGRAVVVVTDRQEILSGENITLYEIESSKLYYLLHN